MMNRKAATSIRSRPPKPDGHLALDIATTTGWSILDGGSPDRPFLGSVRFPSDRGEIGRAAEALRCFLAERHQMHGGFTDIVFEAQHVAGKMDMNVLHRLIGLSDDG
jgi:hypothetical protein